jgi:hypothetical protein
MAGVMHHREKHCQSIGWNASPMPAILALTLQRSRS